MRGFVRVQRRDVRKARIEIVPMIDTIFFLLVFFMFSSLSMVKMKGLVLSVPKDSVPVAKPPPKLVISVDSAGRTLLDTRLIARSALVDDLQAQIDSDPKTIMIVNVDSGRNEQDLVDVLDAVNSVHLPESARADGIDRPAVTIATSPVDAQGNPAPRVGAS